MADSCGHSQGYARGEQILNAEEGGKEGNTPELGIKTKSHVRI